MWKGRRRDARAHLVQARLQVFDRVTAALVTITGICRVSRSSCRSLSNCQPPPLLPDHQVEDDEVGAIGLDRGQERVSSSVVKGSVETR